MHKVSIRKFQANVREYLRLVRGGDVVLIVERGRVIAELKDRSDWVRVEPEHAGLQDLVDRGVVRGGGRNDPALYPPSPVHAPPGTMKRLLDEDRQDR